MRIQYGSLLFFLPKFTDTPSQTSVCSCLISSELLSTIYQLFEGYYFGNSDVDISHGINHHCVGKLC